jgi:hypothetical protein
MGIVSSWNRACRVRKVVQGFDSDLVAARGVEHLITDRYPRTLDIAVNFPGRRLPLELPRRVFEVE